VGERDSKSEEKNNSTAKSNYVDLWNMEYLEGTEQKGI